MTPHADPTRTAVSHDPAHGDAALYVLVFGAGGFIGGHIVQALEAAGHAVWHGASASHHQAPRGVTMDFDNAVALRGGGARCLRRPVLAACPALAIPHGARCGHCGEQRHPSARTLPARRWEALGCPASITVFYLMAAKPALW